MIKEDWCKWQEEQEQVKRTYFHPEFFCKNNLSKGDKYMRYILKFQRRYIDLHIDQIKQELCKKDFKNSSWRSTWMACKAAAFQNIVKIPCVVTCVTPYVTTFSPKQPKNKLSYGWCSGWDSNPRTPTGEDSSYKPNRSWVHRLSRKIARIWDFYLVNLNADKSHDGS